MRMNYSDIKKELEENWENLEENKYPEDALREMADSACPIYYHEIIKDWVDMPNQFTDSWQEFIDPTNETTIFSLMSADLFYFYESEYTRIYNKMKKQKEEQEEED
jgi:hypothetical protein